MSRIEKVEVHAADKLWEIHKDRLGLSREDFLKYSNGRATLSVILLRAPKELARVWNLEEIRAVAPTFRPPQYYKRFDKDDPLLVSLVDSLMD